MIDHPVSEPKLVGKPSRDGHPTPTGKSTSRDFDGDQDKRRQMMRRQAMWTTAKISL